jgi:hypothetical protein
MKRAGLDSNTANIFKIHFRRKIFKNGVFWDVTPCGSCKNRRFGGTSQRASVVSYGYVLSSPILVTLMMEALSHTA